MEIPSPGIYASRAQPALSFIAWRVAAINNNGARGAREGRETALRGREGERRDQHKEGVCATEGRKARLQRAINF